MLVLVRLLPLLLILLLTSGDSVNHDLMIHGILPGNSPQSPAPEEASQPPPVIHVPLNDVVPDSPPGRLPLVCLFVSAVDVSGIHPLVLSLALMMMTD